MIISPRNTAVQRPGNLPVGIYRSSPVFDGPGIVITQQLHSVEIRTSPSPTPWSIDPERTQEL